MIRRLRALRRVRTAVARFPVISSFLRVAVDTLFSFLSDSCALILCFRSDVVFREMLLRFC